MKNLLIINDEIIPNIQIMEIIETLNYETVSVSLCQEALSYILLQQQPTPNLLIADINSLNKESINLLRMINAIRPELPIIIITQQADNNHLIEEIASVTSEVIYKPFINQKLESSIKNHLKIHAAVKKMFARSAGHAFKINDFIGSSPSWRSIINQAQLAINSDQPILIYGETGVGKNLISHIIHDESGNHNANFVSKAITSDESKITEYCQKAKNGSLQLYIDNKSDFEWKKIIHLAKEHKIRIIINYKQENSLSSKHLENLFSIPNIYNIYIPPLRHRQDDILFLAEHFNKLFARTYGKRCASLSSKAITHLVNSPWVGNVRQIQWIFQNIIQDNNPKTITSKHIISTNETRPWEENTQSKKHINLYTENGKLRSLEEIEQEIIRHALHSKEESRCEIAKKLGIGRTTLYRKMQQQTA